MKRKAAVFVACLTLLFAVSAYAGNGQMEKVPCSYCDGSGYNPAKEYPPSFGHGRQIKESRCEICGSYDVHYHKRCPSCNGKGYVMKFMR